MKIKSLMCLFVSVFLTFAAQTQEAASDDIKSRIQPLGKVHVAGAKPETSSAGPRSGAQVYNKSCVACHSVGVLGAPKLHDAADWGPRMSKGIDTLVEHGIKGFNAMPPKGTCGDCSDDEIKAAIEYMIEGL
ncbi:c-type cytochrome [Paraglaciecola hydrolytica]|uniref:Cytochrome C n=1 Tax=Paraglaciecola hydrolytica TaxID=1799789 RepID=A0A136A3H1_9ALTE|nr:cytochrome c5 family protein [Paraglaciecola hydrolytica]KXI29788.1 cytochrome C [Paraglaciecola hydrolytica]